MRRRRTLPILLVLALLGSATALSCSGSASEEELPAKAGKKPKKTKTQKAPPAAPQEPEDPPPPPPEKEPAPPEEPVESDGGPAPALPALAWTLGDGTRVITQVRTRFEATRGGKTVRRRVVDGSRFLRVSGASGDAVRAVRLEPNPIEDVVEGELRPRGPAARAEFLLLQTTGTILPGSSAPVPTLLQGLAELVFPAEGPPQDGAWSLERDFAEGRFVVSWRVTGTSRSDGVEALAIEAAAQLPGGSPCETLTLHEAAARFRFDPAQGCVLSGEGSVAYVMGEGEEATECRGSFELVFFGSSAMEAQEARDAAKALEAWFSVLNMIESKRYSGAERAVEAFLDENEEPAYVEVFYDILARIPDPRSLQQEGLLDRTRFDFLSLPWNRTPGPPIFVMGLGKTEPGAPRTLALAGQPLPEFWWKGLHRGGDWGALRKEWTGKVLLVHVWASWVPPCVESLAWTVSFAEKEKERGLRLLGITLDTEGKDLGEYIKAQKVEHPTVWDVDNRTVEEYGLPGIPAFLVVDRKGMVRFAELGWFGDATTARIGEAVNGALK